MDGKLCRRGYKASLLAVITIIIALFAQQSLSAEMQNQEGSPLPVVVESVLLPAADAIQSGELVKNIHPTHITLRILTPEENSLKTLFVEKVAMRYKNCLTNGLLKEVKN